jgi:hypothetical protein
VDLVDHDELAVGPEAELVLRVDQDEAALLGPDSPPGPAAFGARDALLVFRIALILRLAHLWFIRDMPFVAVPIVDALAYDEWGQRIAAGNWLESEVFYQAPLYSYFLGSFYAVFGRDLMAVHVLQMAMGRLSCLLLALAASALFRDRAVALATGLSVAVYPPAIFFDALIGKQGLGLLLLSGLLSGSGFGSSTG